MFEGKVAVITGAGGGIGYGLAHACAKEGMNLVLTAYHPERLEFVANKIREGFGVEVATITGDVSVEDDVKKIAAFALEKFGKVNMLFNNAGVHFHKSFEVLTDVDWEFMLRCNFWSLVYGMRTFLPILRENEDGGHIINTAAMGSVMPTPTMAHYTATKFANLGLTQAVQIEEQILHGGKVQLHAILPSMIGSHLMDGAAGLRASNPKWQNPVEEQTELDKKMEAELRSVVPWDFESDTCVGLHPFAAGDLVMAQIKEGKNFIFTHPEVKDLAIAAGNMYASGYLSDLTPGAGKPGEDAAQ